MMNTQETVLFDKSRLQGFHVINKAYIYLKHTAKSFLYGCMGATMIILLTACSVFPDAIAKELPAEPIPTPTLCTPLPADMTFQVTPLSRTSLAIAMTGLQPGEIPTVIVQASTPDESLHLEETPTQPVDASGQFNWDVFGLKLGSSGTVPSLNWAVLVKHARGVACATHMLP